MRFHERIGHCDRFSVARKARVAPGREHRRTASDAGTRHCKPAANADADARLAKPAARSFTCAEIAGEIEAKEHCQHGERITRG